MPVVELAGVTKAYDTKVAVDDLSLTIEAGQMFGLLGPNGAGKTSSIRMMMGITIPDSGKVNLFNKPFERASLNRVGYLPEERGLYKKMKVIDQLVFFGCLHGLATEDARRRATDWAMRMEIADALQKEWGAPPVRIRTLGGGVPAGPFIEAFNVPTVGVSLANYDDNQHADDENLRLGNLWDGIASLAAIMAR